MFDEFNIKWHKNSKDNEELLIPGEKYLVIAATSMNCNNDTFTVGVYLDIIRYISREDGFEGLDTVMEWAEPPLIIKNRKKEVKENDK